MVQLSGTSDTPRAAGRLQIAKPREKGRVGAVGKRRPNANEGVAAKVIGSDAPTNAYLKHAKSALWLSLRCECAMKPYQANFLE
jgi:hypothetical protein